MWEEETRGGDSDGNEDPEWRWVFAFPKTGRHVGEGDIGAVPPDTFLRYVTDCFVSILVHRLKSRCYHQESTKN